MYNPFPHCQPRILFAPVQSVAPKIEFKYTNKMQRYTVFFSTVNALDVSRGFSAHHQELKTVYTASGICQACLLLVLAIAASKLCVQF
jgi:hypothetical protein